MKISEKIKILEEENNLLEDKIDELIDEHLIQINQIIEEKILKLKTQLQEESIIDVCGDNYTKLTKKIKINKNYIDMFSNISNEEEFIEMIKDIVIQKDEDTNDVIIDKDSEDHNENLQEDGTATKESIEE